MQSSPEERREKQYEFPHLSNGDPWVIQQDNGPTAEILKVGLGFYMI